MHPCLNVSNMNHNDVTPGPEDHLAAVRAYDIALRAEYAKPEPDRRTIAALNSKIGRGVKLAEVKALINIGRQLERLVSTTPGQYLVEDVR